MPSVLIDCITPPNVRKGLAAVWDRMTKGMWDAAAENLRRTAPHITTREQLQAWYTLAGVGEVVTPETWPTEELRLLDEATQDRLEIRP